MIDGATPRWSRIEWLLACCLVLAVRGRVLIAAADRLEQDPDSYRLLGQTWSRTGTFGVAVPRTVEIVGTRRESAGPATDRSASSSEFSNCVPSLRR